MLQHQQEGKLADRGETGAPVWSKLRAMNAIVEEGGSAVRQRYFAADQAARPADQAPIVMLCGNRAIEITVGVMSAEVAVEARALLGGGVDPESTDRNSTSSAGVYRL